ncbi:MAG: methyltransferase domain-containing protein [candidate division Zixibacteria bacterium]|nr:methyltransferase domain-containing protein [candidate division Zixibacteria bacterium]
MTQNKTTGKVKHNEWFRESFTNDYLWLYTHRSDGEAKQQVRTALKLLPYVKGQHVLDIACGAGRHMLAMASKGACVTGVDLSKTLLKTARAKLKSKGYKAVFLNKDMRQIEFRERFDGAMMWFTSFGYFPKKSDDRKVLANIQKSLKPGGWWWIDLPNPLWLENNLVSHSSRIANGPNGKAEVDETRRIYRGRIQKITTITDRKGTKKLIEDVRLYSPETFGSMIKSAGLTAWGVIGEYDGAALTADSTRQIWFGVRK